MESVLNTIYARCPSCTKLYSVDKAELRPTNESSRVEFECIACSKRFWMQTPVPTDAREAKTYLFEEAPIISPKSEVAEPLHPTFPCPHCNMQNAKGSIECKKCGTVFDKARKMSQGLMPLYTGSQELKLMWERILSDYTNMGLHESFIRLASERSELPFASQQYRRILEAQPNEALAQKMRDRIIELATSQITLKPRRSSDTRAKKINLPVMILAIGLAFVFFGFVFESAHSLMPLGGFFCAISLGILYFFRQNRVE